MSDEYKKILRSILRLYKDGYCTEDNVIDAIEGKPILLGMPDGTQINLLEPALNTGPSQS